MRPQRGFKLMDGMVDLLGRQIPDLNCKTRRCYGNLVNELGLLFFKVVKPTHVKI